MESGVRGLGLGFTNPVGTGGVSVMASQLNTDLHEGGSPLQTSLNCSS